MFDGKDELMVIQEDIKRAIGKGSPNWAMLIDLRRCTKCSACTAGCVAEQKSPPGIIYRPVYEEEEGKFPKVKLRFTPRPCQQCDKPACVAACPKKGVATWKATEGIGSGIVMIDYRECIGCGKCVIACPYKARALDAGLVYTEGTPKVEEYELAPTWEYAAKWPRIKGQPPIEKARKCHFCYHRLKNGMLPMCVSTCISRANYFGDINDKESLLSKVMKAHKVKVLKEVKGRSGKNAKASDLNKLSPAEYAKALEYPGAKPVFADSASAKPRVFYILP